MKKNFKFYLITWGLFLALFNLITFIIPAAEEAEKYTGSFWVGYSFITLSFVGQLACAFMVFKRDESRKVFYNVSLLQISFTGLLVSFVAGATCMIIPAIPYWVSVIICAVVLVMNAISVIKANVVIDAVVSVDEKIKTRTFFIKSLTVDAETLMARAKDEIARAECRKVFEAIRYSDPMSNAALSSVESQITIKFAALTNAVMADDTGKVAELANEVCILIGDRNRKCKLLKNYS